jgi:hypothetical protein
LLKTATIVPPSVENHRPRKPLVPFTSHADPNNSTERRARLESETRSLMPSVTRAKAKSSAKRRSKAASKTKVRLVKGRVRLRVAGHKGVQNLAPAHLVRYVGVSQLKQAAKKYLKAWSKGKQKPAAKRRRKRGNSKRAKRGNSKRAKRRKLRRGSRRKR